MKRRDSFLIALGVAAVCGLPALLLLGQSGRERPAASPSAEALASPSASVTQIVASPSADPEQSPEPSVPPSAPVQPSPAETDVVFDPPGDQKQGMAGVVAGAEYDFSQPVPESEAVGDDYFADAVFIGDSRTDGFRLYSGLTQGEYLVKTGLSVFKIEKDQVKVEGRKMTVPEALERKSYGKVYVCLGLNELGMYDDQGYYDHYAALIDRVRAAQPQAAVYIQLLIPVNEQKCAEKGVADYINNQQIGVYNGLLRQLAQDKRVFLTDPAQAIVDPATGQPPYDVVADGVHFQKGPYQQWLDYLKRHTAQPALEPEAVQGQEWVPEIAPEVSQEENAT